jgi:hypothetical protein
MRLALALLFLAGCNSPVGTKFSQAVPEIVIVDSWEYRLYRIENDVFVQILPNSGALTILPDDARARRESVAVVRETYNCEIDAATVKHGAMAMTATLSC